MPLAERLLRFSVERLLVPSTDYHFKDETRCKSTNC
jgi:hypothetical protein